MSERKPRAPRGRKAAVATTSVIASPPETSATPAGESGAVVAPAGKKKSSTKSRKVTNSTVVCVTSSIEATEDDNIILYLPIKEEPVGAAPHAHNDDIYATVDRVVSQKENCVEGIITRTPDGQVVNVPKQLMIAYDSSGTPIEYPKRTNLVCFWDGCPFGGVPFFLPVRREETEGGPVFHVCKNFCSPCCALAFNKYVAWGGSVAYSERTELIYELANLLYGGAYVNEKIPIANFPDSLDTHGGYQTISEFRSAFSLHDKKFTMNYPPISIVMPQITEVIHLPTVAAK